MTTAADVRRLLAERSDPERAAGMSRFFKTGKGEYGEGDLFIGVTMPAIRESVRRAETLPVTESSALLRDAEHEHRMAGLVSMVDRFRTALGARAKDDGLRRELHAAYVCAVDAGRVNNWDLVDVSAEWLIGEHLRVEGLPRELIDRFVADDDLWRRRVGILSTFAWTKAGDPAPVLTAAEAVLDDRRDLIQKASGWMLREAGKRADLAALIGFLDEHAASMPRTMLSYATEHLSPGQRAEYRRR